MSFSRKTIIYAAAPLTLAGMLATTAATAASAAPLPRQATGSMELGGAGGTLQYETFLALQGGRYHGVVDYTNWTYAEPGSGVYAPAQGPHALVFTFGGTYAHTLNGGLLLTALSPDRLAFSGTGEYNGTPAQAWAIKGQVNDSRLTATIAYNGSAYKVVMNGKIAMDGSVSGTAKDTLGQALTFTMPAGSFASVLHYIAPVQSAQVHRSDATFKFTIPAKVAGLGGTKVTVKVHDGGWGARHDRYAHGVTGTPLVPYPILGGPGVTIR